MGEAFTRCVCMNKWLDCLLVSQYRQAPTTCLLLLLLPLPSFLPPLAISLSIYICTYRVSHKSTLWWVVIWKQIQRNWMCHLRYQAFHSMKLYTPRENKLPNRTTRVKVLDECMTQYVLCLSSHRNTSFRFTNAVAFLYSSTQYHRHILYNLPIILQIKPFPQIMYCSQFIITNSFKTLKTYTITITNLKQYNISLVIKQWVHTTTRWLQTKMWPVAEEGYHVKAPHSIMKLWRELYKQATSQTSYPSIHPHSDADSQTRYGE